MKRWLLLGVVLAMSGCAAQPAATQAPYARVHEFYSGEGGIFANAYLVETRTGVVAIDATLLESTSKDLRKKLIAIGKPLKAVLLTHGHPDHYNGVTNLLAGETVDVVSTPGTDRVIRESDAAKEKQWSPVFKSEWPAKRTFPTRTLIDGAALEIDGVKFTVHDLGKGESHSDSYWVMESGGDKTAFIGDVVLNRVHAYVSDEHTAQWLANIERVKRDLRGIEKIYPGHGEAGDLSMLDWQRQYLMDYRRAVAELAANKPQLTDAAKQRLVERMKAVLPNGKLEFLISLGADAVARELVDEKR